VKNYMKKMTAYDVWRWQSQLKDLGHKTNQHTAGQSQTCGRRKLNRWGAGRPTGAVSLLDKENEVNWCEKDWMDCYADLEDNEHGQERMEIAKKKGIKKVMKIGWQRLRYGDDNMYKNLCGETLMEKKKAES